MSVEFQPAVIVEFASRLYKQADRLVITWMFALGILGFLAGSMAGSVARMSPLMPGVVISLIGALFGASYGRNQGFEMRLRAQQAMCQLQIEINTRPR